MLARRRLPVAGAGCGRRERGPTVTRLDAPGVLRDLAHGLDADAPGVLRVLERTAEATHGEELRAVLVELGALAVLRELCPPPGEAADWPRGDDPRRGRPRHRGAPRSGILGDPGAPDCA